MSRKNLIALLSCSALFLIAPHSKAATALSANSTTVTASSGNGTFSLTQSPAAAWTAVSSASWLTVSPASGNGSQTISYSFTANSSVNSRTAAILVAGQRFSVIQLGTTGNYTPWGSSFYDEVRTIAGNGSYGSGGDGGQATSANVASLSGTAVDANGNVYFADTASYRIRVVNAATGIVSTAAGSGYYGSSGDGSAATSADFEQPSAIAVDFAGNLYIADTYANRIRRVDAVTGYISTVAGNGYSGYQGDGGAATAAELNQPRGLAVDNAGNIYISDTGNNVIRKVSGGKISTFAGTGTYGFSGDGGLATAATIYYPLGLAVDAGGNLYIADYYDSRIRRVDAGTLKISTFAGNGNSGFYGDGGAATSAWLGYPNSVAVDAAGDLLIGDSSNYRIRFVSAATGNISTVAGGAYGYSGDGGLAVGAAFDSIQGISVDGAGNVVVSDTSNYRLRFIDLSSPSISLPGTAGVTSAAGTGTLPVTVAAGGPFWTASSSASWLTLSASAGSGNGNVSYSYTANTSVAFREAVISVSGAASVVTQAGAKASLSSYSAIAAAAAGTGTVNLTVTPAASWTSTSSASWLTLSPSSGNAGAALTYTFSANTSASSRTATLTIAGKSFTVTQLGSGGNYTQWGSSAAGNIRSIAGNGSAGFSGDGGAATSASLYYPSAVALDGNGNVFIADRSNARIRRVDASTGNISTVAGNGNYGYSGDGAAATSASLGNPQGIAADSAGNLYIADSGNNRIRRVDAVSGIITTYAGNGNAAYSGNGGPATSASLSNPSAVALDSAGNLFIADSNNYVVRRVDALTGYITAVAGNGSSGYSGDGAAATSAQISTPLAVALDSAGDLFIADGGNYRVRRVDAVTGNISTVAGNGSTSGQEGVAATASGFYYPYGIAVDAAGNLFISDYYDSVVRRVDASTGIVSLLAGIPYYSSFGGDGGPATSAYLNNPDGLATDPAGNLYIADYQNQRVRFIDNSTPHATLGPTGATATYSAGTGSVSLTVTPATGIWSAASSASWLTLTNPSGTGSGSIAYSYTANSSVLARSATISVLGQTYTLTQTGSVVTLAPVTATVAAAAGSGAATLTVTPAASWAASSSASWLTVTPASGSAGTGLTYSWTANTGTAARTAAISVAGKKLTVTQLGSGGSYTAWGSSSYGQIRTIAGNGNNGYSGDGSAATAAGTAPQSAAVDSNGNIFIADTGNLRIRRIDAATGNITTVAGNGNLGFGPDNVAATGSGIGQPSSVAVDGAGNLFIVDDYNYRLRRVDGISGLITSVAGTGVSTSSGDGGLASAASFRSPVAVTVDGSGNLFVAEYSKIRRIDGVTGIISTVAGTGVQGFSGDSGPATAALLGIVQGIAVDSAGNLFIADSGNNRIRRVDALTGIITTVAGSASGSLGDGGPATSAALYYPSQVAVDASGNLFIADTSSRRIRRVDAVSGNITTVAGSGNCCFGGDGGPAVLALLANPTGIALDSSGSLYISDPSNARLRFVDLATPQVSLASASGAVTSAAGSGSVAISTTPSGAPWVASSSAAWLTLSTASGSGSGTIGYSYTANASVTPRSALITVYGASFTLTQAGSAVTLSPSSATLGSAAGTGTTTLTVTPAAAWTASSSASWLTVTPASGTAGTTLTYSYTANTGTTAREATITAAGKNFNVLQTGTGGSYSEWGTTGYGQITTVAGNGATGFSGDGGPATQTSLYGPSALAIDGSGNIYIADSDNSRIRRVNSATGTITTVAGSGGCCALGDGGPATSALLAAPGGVAVDSSGDIFIADTQNNRIRRVDGVSGNISTIAGTGTFGYAGDGGLATAAQVSQPHGLALDSTGNLFVADTGNNVVRRIDASTGVIRTVAGTGAAGFSGDGAAAVAATLTYPGAVALDSGGNLFIADTGNNRIRRVDATTGNISTFAGNGCCGATGDGGPASLALLNAPQGVVVDASGNVYIADTVNNRIRRVDSVTGNISTVAGTGVAGFSGDGGPALAAKLYSPQGLALDGSGNLYVGDVTNSRVRVIDFATPQVTLAASTAAVPVTAGTGTVGLTIAPTGAAWTAASNAAWLTLTAGSGSGNGSIGYSYTANSSLTSRTGTVTVFGQTLTVTQAGAVATLSPASGTSGPAAGTFTVTLTVTPSAAWTASAASSWLTVSPASGTASGPVTLTYAANSSALPRTAVVSIAGNVFTFVQTGTADTYTPWGPSGSGQIKTIAGTGVSGFSGDGGSALSAQLAGAGDVAVDAGGNVYFSDPLNNRVRRITAATGVISTVAGNGSLGSTGDGGPAFSAQLANPLGIALDSAGNLFIADSQSYRVRRVDAVSGIITTVAGEGVNYCCAVGDGGPATSASLNFPEGVAVDSHGNLFISDTYESRIRRVDGVTGIITTVAGSGNYSNGFAGDGGPATSASLNYPQRVILDSIGNLFISDSGNNRIRRVDAVTGIITTVAGSGSCCGSGDGGPATAAGLYSPYGIAFDARGDLYIADSSDNKIRRVDAITGTITTVAGTGTNGFSGDGGLATSAMISNAQGVATDASGNLYIADSGNARIRFVDNITPPVTLASSSASAPVTAGTGTVAITVGGSGSVWAASSNASWLTLTTATGSGNGTIGYSYTANNSLGARTGTISVFGQTFTVTQAGASTSLSAPFAIVSPAAGSGSVTLTVTPSASWSASSSASWLTVTPASGTASGTVSYSFTANTAAGPRSAALMIGNRSFTVLQLGTADSYTPWGTGAYGNIQTVAGNGTGGFLGDGGPAVSGEVNSPSAVATDASGNIYIADTNNSRIRRVDAISGNISTVAGTGVNGFSGDGGPASAASFETPNALAIDGSGNIFVADYSFRIRRIDAVSGKIATVAGNGSFGYSGDGGAATAAAIGPIAALTVDASGNMYLASSAYERVRRVDAVSGIITTVAGTGSGGFSGDGGPALLAQLNNPVGLAVDGAGNLFISDGSNNRIRRVDASTGNIATFAGTGVPVNVFAGSSAQLNGPAALAIDRAGNLFVADSSSRVWRIDAVSGAIGTVAGNGSCCVASGDGGPATSAGLYAPAGIAVDGTGNLYIAQSQANRIRFVDFTTPQVSFAPSQPLSSAAGTGTVGLTITPAGSLWTAATNASWLTLTTVSGSGNGSIAFSYTANNSVSPRSALISVYGQNATITQAGSVAAVSPASAVAGAASGTGTVTLTVTPAAPWTAASSASWLTVSPSSGSAGATLTYAFSANTSTNARSATLTIAGQTFPLLQNGVPAAGGSSWTEWGTTVYGQITTVAGAATGGFAGDGGPATAALLSGADSVVPDGNGNFYIADTANNRVRFVNAATGAISTIVGTGIAGFGGDNGPAAAASLYLPRGLALDSAGNLYIADTSNNRIRVVSAATGIITTLAGSSAAGGYSGDGGPASQAQILFPYGVAVDSAGNVYIADQGNNRVRFVNGLTGLISTIAGSGAAGNAGDGGPATSAQLSNLSGVAVDGSGNVFIADSGNSRVRRVDALTGNITTYAGGGIGGDGSLATAASLSGVRGVALDAGGNLYVTENGSRVRRVDAVTKVITTAAGTSTAGFSGDGGPAIYASLSSPQGVATDPTGNLYIADAGNNRIRFVDFTTPQAAFAAASINLTEAAGSKAVGLTLTPSSAPWLAATTAPWITLTPASGSGSGNLTFTYTANASVSARTGLISVYGRQLIVNQAGSAVALAQSSVQASSTAGSNTVAFTVTPAAAWTASSSASWLTVTPASGNAGGTVTVHYTANPGANARLGAVNIGGQILSVLQAGTSGLLTPWGTNANAEILTIAGTGSAGYSGDGGAGKSAELDGPFGMAVDSNGNVFIADTANNRIRRVDAGTGVITTFAGTGTIGFAGDNGPAASAQLSSPRRIAFDAAGNLFVADTGNNRIRRIDAVTGNITTVAGGASIAGIGDGGAALSAALNTPSAIAVDGAGNLYIADTGNNRIRVVNAATGLITTLAGGNAVGGYAGDGGSATAAQLNFPRGIGLDPAGDVFIADFANNRIRRVDAVTGTITTVAGTGSNGSTGDGGPATAAQLNSPWDVTVDAAGDLFIADNLNQRVRRVDGVSGLISTVAGNGMAGSTGDGGAATSAQLNSPAGVALDSQKNLYIAETVNQRIRFVDFTTPPVVAPGGGGGGGGVPFQPTVSTLTASPASLTFNASPGNAAASQTITLASSTGPAAYTASATLNSGIGWLSVSPASGSTDTQGTLTVSVNAASLPTGTYSGTVNVTSGSSLASVTVTLNVNGQLTVSPAALSFTWAQGDPNTPAASSISVFTNPAGLTYTANAASTGGWLSVTGAGGATPSSFPVSVNVGSLAPGTYSGTVAISSTGAGSTSVPVTLTITAPTPKLTVSPASRNLTAIQRGTPISGQITVSNSGGGTLQFAVQAASDSGNWLTLTGGASGSATASSPAAVAYMADPTNLSPGLHTGTITVTDSASGNQQTATVMLAVSPASQSIVLSQTGMAFATIAGGLAPPAQTFTVSNAGSGTMGWTVSSQVLANPLSTANWLTATAGNGNVSVSVNPTGLPAGQYYGSVNVIAAGASNSPQTVSVTLTVGSSGQAGGAVSVSTGGILLTGAAGSGRMQQQLSLFSPGSTPIAWSSTVSTASGSGWLSVTPSSGTLAAGSNLLNVAADFTSLTAGAQNGAIRIALADGTVFNIGVVAFATGAQAHAASGCTAGKPGGAIAVFRSPLSQAVLTAGSPQDVQVQLLDNCGNAVTAASGGTAQAIVGGSTALDLHDIGGGVWETTWTPSAVASQVSLSASVSENGVSLAGLSAPITVSVVAAPAGAAAQTSGVVNAAAGSLAPAQVVAAGSYVAIYGSGLSTAGAVTATSAPFPTTLNGAQVLLGGVALPLYYASPTQINALIPIGLNANVAYPFVVVRGSTQSVPVPVTVVQLQPGIYTENASGSGQGAVEIAGTALLAAPAGNGSRPVIHGQEALALFATGLGAVQGPNGEAPPAAGAAASSTIVYSTTAQVTATVGGVNAPVLFAGLTPTLVSLYQLNISVPAGVAPGNAVPVVITVTDPVSGQAIQSNTVTVAVQ